MEHRTALGASGDIKSLMAEYYKLQKMTRQVAALRKTIIFKLKESGMTGTAFRFQDSTIKYAAYYRYADISKEHVREIISSYYPDIDTELFVKRLWDGRHKTKVETIRTYSKGQVDIQEDDWTFRFSY